MQYNCSQLVIKYTLEISTKRSV